MSILKSIKCIECNKGGDLVFCNGSDCPIAVHEQCVALPISLDENGKFYCPYCSYKRALLRELVLREKVSLEKQALLEFVNFKAGEGGGSGGCGDDGERGNGGEENGEGVLISGDDGRGSGDDGRNGAKRKKGEKSGGGKCGEGLVDGDDDGVGGQKCVQMVDDDEVVALRRVVGEKDDGRCSREERMKDDCLNVNDGDGKNCEKDEVDRSNEVVENTVSDDENDDCCGQEERIEDIGLNVNEGDENICDKNEDGTLLEEEKHCEQSDDIEIDERVVEGDKQVETDVLSAREDGSPKVDEISCDSDSKPLATRRRQSDHGSKYALRQRHVSPKILSPQRKISKKKSNQKREVSPSKKPKKSLKSPSKFTNLKFASEKRKRLSWKPEEEEMLKEGVQKYSSNANKNIPWRKILDFGRHVFDSSRTPTDLKDKWKNIMAKEF